MEIRSGTFDFTDDKTRIDLDKVVALLNSTYWASTRSRDAIEKSIENSVCFSVFLGKSQIGFGRAITDQAVYSLILDIVIHEKYRGKGLGKAFFEFMVSHPKIKDSSQVLWTKDAQAFYAAFGFRESQELSVLFKKT